MPKLRSVKEISEVRDLPNKTPEESGDQHLEGNLVPHGQNKDEAPLDQTGQKFKAVDVTVSESTNSQVITA